MKLIHDLLDMHCSFRKWSGSITFFGTFTKKSIHGSFIRAAFLGAVHKNGDFWNHRYSQAFLYSTKNSQLNDDRKQLNSFVIMCRAQD